jgi:hypothetical protein
MPPYIDPMPPYIGIIGSCDDAMMFVELGAATVAVAVAVVIVDCIAFFFLFSSTPFGLRFSVEADVVDWGMDGGMVN